MRPSAFRVARGLGVLAAGGSALLWINLTYLNPYARGGTTHGSYVLAWIMISLATLGALSAWQYRPLVTAVVAVASFAPFGFYLLLTPGIFKLIGISNLLLLLSAVAMYESRGERKTPTTTSEPKAQQ